MAPSFHELAFSPIIHGLRNALAILKKGEAHAAANSVDPADYTTARLYPDMDDFCSQVYRFTDSAKGMPFRINPSNPSLALPDVEKTFPELIARVEKTLAFVESIKPESIDGREDSPVSQFVRNNEIELCYDTAAQFVTTYVIPNFFFHTMAMYSLLRMKGVPVGKMDWLNSNQTMKFRLQGGEISTDFSKIMAP